jgi:hypothetical protein
VQLQLFAGCPDYCCIHWVCATLRFSHVQAAQCKVCLTGPIQNKHDEHAAEQQLQMTAAAGTVVSCTVFLPAVMRTKHCVPQTLIDQLHTRRVSFLHVDCCVACLHRSNIRFFYCASRMPESLSKLHAESAHNWYCRHCKYFVADCLAACLQHFSAG